MFKDKLFSEEAIEERAAYYEKWASDIRANNGTSVDADHADATAAVLRGLALGEKANLNAAVGWQKTSVANAAALSSLRAEVLEAISVFRTGASPSSRVTDDDVTHWAIKAGDARRLIALAARLSREDRKED